MRAFLFAKATVAMFLFRRSTIRVSQLSACSTLRSDTLITALAPWISSVLR